MTISTLNIWRKVYLAEAVLVAAGPSLAGGRAKHSLGKRCLAATLIVGASLWLMHDLAHGRWRAAIGDLVALLGCALQSPWAVVAGVLWAAAEPEKPPSPFIWRRSAPRDTS